MSHVKQQKRVAKVQDNQGVFSSSPHCNLFSLLCSLFTQNDAEKKFQEKPLDQGNEMYQAEEIISINNTTFGNIGKKNW